MPADRSAQPQRRSRLRHRLAGHGLASKLRLAFVAPAALVAVAAIGGPALAGSEPARAAAKDVKCIDDPLGGAQDWTLVIHGDLVQSNTDSEGRIAAGGDATLTNFGVASHLPVDSSRVDLAVGHDLNATNVGVNNGSIIYGDALTGNATAPNGTITKRPLDLDAWFQEAQRRADGWQELDPNGTVSGPDASGALSLTGTDSKLNVFRIKADDLEGAQRILLRVPFGSSTLVNVLGTSYSTAADPQTVSVELWNGSAYVQFGDQAPNEQLEAMQRALLWNFADAKSVQIGPNLAWHGSVLAPGAALSFPGSTQLNGTIIAGSLAGDGESHLHTPKICLPDPGPTPPTPPTPPPPTPPTPPNPPTPPTPPTPPSPNPPSPTPPSPTPPSPNPPSPTPPSPGPPSPTPPTPKPKIPSFSADSGPSEGGGLPGGPTRAALHVEKQVLNRHGRRVESIRTRPGRLVRFRLWGYNRGFASARRVVICDRVPRGLRLVHAPANPTLRHRRLCWRLGTVDTQRQAIVKFRVRKRVCRPAIKRRRRLTNRIVVRSANAGRRRDAARVIVRCSRRSPREPSPPRPSPPHFTG